MSVTGVGGVTWRRSCTRGRFTVASKWKSKCCCERTEEIGHKKAQRAQKKTADKRGQSSEDRSQKKKMARIRPSVLCSLLGFLLCPLCFFVANQSSLFTSV